MQQIPTYSGWNRFWHDPVRGERLGLIRILTALFLLLDQGIQYFPNLAIFFGPHGLAAPEVNEEFMLRTWRWTYFFFQTDNMFVIGLTFAIWTLATLALLVGWRTRWVAPLVWLLTLCFINRDFNLKNGGDDVLLAILFLLMFAPCGNALSVDRLRDIRRGIIPRTHVPWIEPWGVRLFQIQLGVIYLTTAIAKMRGTMWFEGTVLHYVMNDFTINRWSFAQFPLPLWFTAIMTWSSLAFELTFIPLTIWKRTRVWVLWFGILFHICIFLTMEIGWFSLYSIALYGVWVSDAWWQKHFGPRVGEGVIGGRLPDGAEAAPGDYRVFYDTVCPVCCKSKRTLEKLDWAGRLVFRDIHDRPQMQREAPWVPYSRALKEMIVITPKGRVVGGYDAFRSIAWVVPVLWPLAPIMYLPGVSWIGRKVYRWVAKNRYRLAKCDSGVCSLHLKALSKENLDEDEIQRIVKSAKAEAAAKNPQVAE